MKICNKCNQEKESKDFYFRTDINEHRKECKECFLKICKKYRNGSKRNAILKNKLVWQKEHKENRRIINERYYIKNKHKINKYQKYYKREKQSICARIASNYRARIWYALKKNGGKRNKTLSLLGCNIKFLKEHLESQFKDGMNWGNYGRWEIDHVVPCSNFNLEQLYEQKICFNWFNLQPLWMSENRLKSNKLIAKLSAN